MDFLSTPSPQVAPRGRNHSNGSDDCDLGERIGAPKGWGKYTKSNLTLTPAIF